MKEIPGTVLFDGAQARKGYALNKMCFSFNSAANRAEFLRDEDAYCRGYGPDEAQRALRPRRAGHRRTADRHDQGSVQGDARTRGALAVARIVGAITTSHVPAIGGAVARRRQDDPYWIRERVELAGTQGVELLNWLVARAALGGRVAKVHANYHVPISNTASGMMVLENSA